MATSPNVIVNKSEPSPLQSALAVSRRPVNVEIWFNPGAGHVGILWTKCRWYSAAGFSFHCS